MHDAIPAAQITGVVLAGGRGMRMGGADKGLQLFGGVPLALHTLRRLQAQAGHSLINANRNLDLYQGFGVPVWPDVLPDYAGPLAGFITALQHCTTPWLVTVPCDTPLFPSDLVARLAQAMTDAGADIAMASAPESQADGQVRWYRQPVFCLLRTSLLASLEHYTASGGRKIDSWTAQHQTVVVPFDSAGAFLNVNTLAELQAAQA